MAPGTLLPRRLRSRRILRALLLLFVVWNAVEVHYICRRLQQAAVHPLPGSAIAQPGAGSGSGASASSPDAGSEGTNTNKNEDAVKTRRWQAAIDDLQKSLRLQRPPRVYIASLHWNNEAILRSHWNAAVLDLARALGPENVFVAIHESGSWDRSADALRELDAALADLGVARDIVLDPTTHKEEVEREVPPGTPGWIPTSRGRHELRRIPYLSRLRNRSLAPLRDMANPAAAADATGKGTDVKGGLRARTFDRVLFLGDVVFTVDDVLALLATNGGSYGAACSLDFQKPPSYYDTFALRDADGHEHATHTWPYFRSFTSRRAMKLSVPVPVKSCWNGLVAMPARPFTIAEDPLAFRGIDDSLALHHLEGSECCLIHADNPLSSTKGVFLNPNVRVGYHGEAYDAVHPPPGKAWLSPLQVLVGLWRNRLRRLTTTPAIKEWRARKLVEQWKKEGEKETGSDDSKKPTQRPGQKKRDEKGTFCLINEMQVLVENGWAHV
ncbi:hypothetical protein RB594_004996 [Gaeumannomyces avenae]